MSARMRTFILAVLFIVSPAILYYIDFLFFHDPERIFVQIVDNLAFVPLSVFVVAMIINRLLADREKQAKMQKLNMVVGAFFSEVGNHLLRSLVEYFRRSADVSQNLAVTTRWTDEDFRKAVVFTRNFAGKIDYRNFNLPELKGFMVSKRQFLLALLENPNLLEHESFTELLWATFHLTEELEARISFKDLPETDMQHIGKDIERMYSHLASQWLSYMGHLKASYPYLYSLAVRLHPFQEHPSALIIQN